MERDGSENKSVETVPYYMYDLAKTQRDAALIMSYDLLSNMIDMLEGFLEILPLDIRAKYQEELKELKLKREVSRSMVEMTTGRSLRDLGLEK